MVGIIAEYNPFHNGHLYHINKVKEMFPNENIVLVLVGNFLNRGDISIINKFDKTRIALQYGVDLVVELPFVFATQAADIYAYGAIKILDSLKCDYLVFGSETNDIELLTKIAKTQLDNDLNIKEYLNQGYNYPTSLSKAIKDITNIKIDTPNDLLGISYIKSIISLNSKIKPITIQRTNDYHSLDIDNDIISASSIRNLLKEKKDITRYIPHDVAKYINDIQDYFNIIKHQIIIDDLTKYQDIDKSLNNSLKKHINDVNSVDELILEVKSKNITYNKIKRCLIHILCGYEKQEIDITYIRILGFNSKGKQYLSKIKKEIQIPIITNFNSVLENELKYTKIYSLLTNKDITKEELKTPIIID